MAPLASSSDGVATLSSGGSSSMSAGPAMLLVIACSLLSAPQAGSASARSTINDLFAARISEARHWTALGADELIILHRQSLEFRPGHAFAGEREIGAQGIRGGLDPGCRNRAR